MHYAGSMDDSLGLTGLSNNLSSRFRCGGLQMYVLLVFWLGLIGIWVETDY